MDVIVGVIDHVAVDVLENVNDHLGVVERRSDLNDVSSRPSGAAPRSRILRDAEGLAVMRLGRPADHDRSSFDKVHVIVDVLEHVNGHVIGHVNDHVDVDVDVDVFCPASGRISDALSGHRTDDAPTHQNHVLIPRRAPC